MGRLALLVLLLALQSVTQVSASDTGLAGITYATTDLNWTQSISKTLTGKTQVTVRLTPCPKGIDTTSGAGYQVFISGGGNGEAVNVVSGSCASAASTGTITFTSYYSYPAGSTIGSASSGIQETINVACGTSATTYANVQCSVIIPANGPYVGGFARHSLNEYNVYGTIYFHSSQSVLSGYGVSLNCLGRGPCLQIGDLKNSNHYAKNAVEGVAFRSPTNFSGNSAYAGVAITSTQRASQVVTVSTAAAHGLRVGDMVTLLFTDNSAYWGDAIVTAVPSSTSFQYAHTGSDIALQSTPGVVALAYSAILDNGNGSHLSDIAYDFINESGHFNNFFDIWDDENATIEHFDNNAISLNANANWAGSFIFSAGNQGAGHQVAPVITLRDSNITANGSNCVTDYNSNGLYVENTVCQASGPWQVYASTITGNYQSAYLKNIYSESNIGLNPPCSPSCPTGAKSPFPGLGIAGLIAGKTGSGPFHIAGGGGTQGAFQTGGTGSTPYSYFIVANDVTRSTQTSPMQVLKWSSTGSDSIPVNWPRVANGTDTIAYDVIRMTTPNTAASTYPYTGGCLGGLGGACGYVAQGLSQATACSGGLVCTYIDSGSRPTSAHSGTPVNYPLQGTYMGNLAFWPGSIVSVMSSVMVEAEESDVVGVGLSGNPLQVANQCSNYGATSSGGYTVCLASVTAANNSVKSQTATLMADGGAAGGGQALSKGRLNFTTSPWSSLQAHHIITLIDSQPSLTQSTGTYRPPASANDTWIGTDVSGAVGASSGRLAFGAPVSITHYIHEIGDGVQPNWLERLTSKQKTFAVPVSIVEGNTFTLGDGSPLSQMKIYRVNNVPTSQVPPQSCVDVIEKAMGLTRSDQVTSITPPGMLGNLSLNAYPVGEEEIVLHFCNPSRSEATTPAGAYSFMAVH